MLCHKEIRRIAKGIAGAAYEQMAREDTFFKAYPDENAFIERHWKNFIPDARKSLVALMSGDYPEKIKEDAFNIFVQDRTLQAVNDLEARGSA